MAVVVLSLCSCIRRADVYDTPEKVSPIESQERKLSVGVRAKQLFTSFYSKPLRNADSLELLSLDSTETSSPGIKLYLANFNDGGFILFRDGGEEQMEVIGHSDESSLYFSDAIENPFLAQIFRKSTYAIDPLGPPSPHPTPQPLEQEVCDATYIHCTWGWRGHSNGWFSPYVINDREGIPDNELRSTYPKGEYYNISTFHIWK